MIEFLKRNDLSAIVRAHELVDDGVTFHFEKYSDPDCPLPPVLTVFSAPNYCGVHGNKGAIMNFGAERSELDFLRFDAVESPKPITFTAKSAAMARTPSNTDLRADLNANSGGSSDTDTSTDTTASSVRSGSGRTSPSSGRSSPVGGASAGGASPRFQNEDQMKRALVRAVVRDEVKLVTSLLDDGCDLNHTNAGGLTLLDLATEREARKVKALLEKRGALSSRVLEKAKADREQAEAEAQVEARRVANYKDRRSSQEDGSVASATGPATASEGGGVSSRVPSQEEEDRKTMEETLGEVRPRSKQEETQPTSSPTY